MSVLRYAAWLMAIFTRRSRRPRCLRSMAETLSNRETTCQCSLYVLAWTLPECNSDGGTMPDSRKVTFYHSPRTRSTGTLILLEELGASYELKIINMTADEQRQPAFLAVNPMGKV